MTDRKVQEKPTTKAAKITPSGKPAKADKSLSDAALDEVSGGLNPQPLPPGIVEHNG